MSDLKTNLEQILLEKQTKIIPENIKKDIEIFDVLGTYEGNSSFDNVAKIFETEEEMQADKNANESDLAVIYREEIQNMTADTQTQFITFPETVTLTKAITDSYFCMIRSIDSSAMFDGQIQLTSTMFRFNGYSETGMIEVQYESGDGITYTRTTNTTNPVDLGTIVGIDSPQEWNDNFGYFIQIGGDTFEGLYEYSSYIDKDNVYSVLVSDIAFDYNSTNGITNMTWNGNKYSILNVPSIIELYNKIKEDTGMDLMRVAIDENDNLILFDLKNYNYMCGDIAFDPNKNQLGICSPNEHDYDLILSVATLNLESKTYTLNEYNSSGEVYVNVYKYNWSYFPIKLKTLTYRLNPLGNNKITCNNYFVVGDTTTGYRRQYMENSLIPEGLDGLYVEEYKYQLAPTQLSAAKDLVYNSTYYGVDGANEGTLTQNVSNSFADINAEVYSKIQQAYNNMEPRVLTDNDKTINKNIYFIPTNSNGELLLDTSSVTNADSMFSSCINLQSVPLLDTSNVTTMQSMFYRCSNLTTIPLLDTSKVTNMQSMFSSCINLQSVPLLDTSQVTNMYSTFSNCKDLTTIPLLDTSKVTDMNFMFNGCTNLTTIPQLNTSQATNLSFMFGSCTNLTTIPLLDTSQAINLSSMFVDCTNLQSVPLLNTSSATNMNGMFGSCTNLTTIPQLNTGNVTNMALMFSSCTNLTAIPLLDTSSATNMGNMFYGCDNLNNESLNNILQMCINATKVTTSNKTLKSIGLSETQAQTCTTLSNYSAFTAAGWTTGY